MMKNHRKNENHKPTSLPDRYEPGFLDRMDKRTEIYAALRSAHDQITDDLGGIEHLSHARKCLIERFCFLELTLQCWERAILEHPKGSESMLSRWIQGLNALSGLAKTIGIERKPRKVGNLRSYVEGKEA